MKAWLLRLWQRLVQAGMRPFEERAIAREAHLEQLILAQTSLLRALTGTSPTRPLGARTPREFTYMRRQ